MISILKKKRKLKHQEPLKSPNRFTLENEFFPRFIGNILIILLVFSVFLTLITFRDHLVSEKLQEWHSELLKFSSQHGFGIQDIIIEGRKKTALATLKEQIPLNRKNSILEADLPILKQKIENLPWVEKVELKRSYFPNVLQINLKEKDIVALYQTEGEFYPVDKFGQVLWVDYTPTKPFLVIVGEGAPSKLSELFEMMAKNPELSSHIKAATLYSGRRWDLIFDDLENGIIVKMPEENLDKAYEKLIKINNKYGIFKRKLTFIDLRYPDKVSVRIAQ